MSFFLARIYDALTARAESLCLANWRQAMLGSLSGAVLELGSGTGHNLGYYGQGIERLVLSEPDRHMRQRLLKRASDSGIGSRIELTGQAAESLEFADASFDFVVSTLVLCSVKDPRRSLSQAFRVLRPGGSLLLMEHIAAPIGSTRRRWQQTLDPIWCKFSGGCHLNRDPRDALIDAGFVAQHQSIDEMLGAPGIVGPVLRGVWEKPQG